MEFSSEIKQSWYVHRLHGILHMLEERDDQESRENRRQINLVLHYMVWDHLDFMTACNKAREDN